MTCFSRVSELQQAINRACHISEEKQVLLISGGENLIPTARVCSYSAGTVSSKNSPWEENKVAVLG